MILSVISRTFFVYTNIIYICMDHSLNDNEKCYKINHGIAWSSPNQWQLYFFIFFLLYEKLLYFLKTCSVYLLMYNMILEFISISYHIYHFIIFFGGGGQTEAFFKITKYKLLWHSKARNNYKCQVKNSLFFFLPIPVTYQYNIGNLQFFNCLYFINKVNCSNIAFLPWQSI